jgi:hypothetical protein
LHKGRGLLGGASHPLLLLLVLLLLLWQHLLLHSLLDVWLHLPHKVQQAPKLAGNATKSGTLTLPRLLLLLRLGLVARWRHNAAALEQRRPLRLDSTDARQQLLPWQELPLAVAGVQAQASASAPVLLLLSLPSLKLLLLLLDAGPAILLQAHGRGPWAQVAGWFEGLETLLAWRADGGVPIQHTTHSILPACRLAAAATVLPLLLCPRQPRVHVMLRILHGIVARLLLAIGPRHDTLLLGGRPCKPIPAVMLLQQHARCGLVLLLFKLSLCCQAKSDKRVCCDCIVTRRCSRSWPQG